MAKSMKEEWAYGDRAELARRAGVSKSHLANVLGRRTTMRRNKARIVAAVARRMGYALAWRDLVHPWESTNPLLGKKEK